MDEVVIHPATKRLCENYTANPAHGLLLCGPYGSGKFYLAQYLIANILNVPVTDVNRYPQLLHIQPSTTGTISIDDIRTLYPFLKLKVQGEKPRFIVVENSQTLTQEAQNAFLKLLEEPPHNTYIILTATNTNALLATIRSRTQIIAVKTPLKQDIYDFFAAHHKQQDIERFYHISGGQVGLMAALLGDGDHELIPYIDQAKQLLRASLFDRLILVNEYTKQKNHNIAMLLLGFSAIARAALMQAVKKDNYNEIKRWVRIQRVLYTSENALPHNPQAKLMLTDLMLQL